MRYWLMKTEPEVFSIDDLMRAPGSTSAWEGVRNYQARNFMRDGMKKGDRVLIYHSSTSPTAVAGTARVSSEAYPDATAWQPGHEYFDRRSTPEKPVWMMVDVTFEQKFPVPVTLEELRTMPDWKTVKR